MDKLNQSIPYLWGMIIIIQIIIMLYASSIFQGILLGFTIGMLIENIFINSLWKLMESYKDLTRKLLKQNRKMLELRKK